MLRFTLRFARVSIIAFFTFTSVLLTSFFSHATPIFINEIHYDNDGSDVNEFIEVAGVAGTDLSAWSLALYRDTGTVYDSLSLSGVISNQSNGFGAIGFAFSSIQNGSRDGIALVKNNELIQLISYEGIFTAVAGPAIGKTSEDIGVQETSSTSPIASLSLVGTGRHYENFSWSVSAVNSKGSLNQGQHFLTVAVHEPSILLLFLFVTLLLISRSHGVNWLRH